MVHLIASSGGSADVAVSLMIILLVAAVVATVFARMKLEAIPGYLVAGALVGPHALKLVRETERVDQISQLAVVLLMFSIGLHLDARAIGRGMVHILAIGVTSTAAFVALAFPLLMAIGVSRDASLALAMAFSLSSTAIFVRMVGARREVRAVHARVGLGVSIVQDLLAVVMLAVLPFLSSHAAPKSADHSTVLSGEWIEALPAWAEVATRAGIGIGGIILLIAIARSVLPAMLRWIARTGSSELMLVFSGAVALAAAIGTSLLGFSPEMGAFLAGFFLASTPFRHQLAGQFAPMRDILMAVFFTAVGLQVNPAVIAEHAGAVILGCIGLAAAKVVTLGVCGWALGLPPRAAWLTGVYLGNSGEFSLVVIKIALSLAIISPNLNAVAIAAVIASLVISPLLVGPAHQVLHLFSRLPLAPWIHSPALREQIDHAAHPEPADDDHEGHAADGKPLVIIAGFGPVGRAIADRLEVVGIAVVIVELNPNTVERQAKIGKRRIVYGDVTNPDVLESAGVPHAHAIIVTIPDEETSLRACREARRQNSTAFIAVRTSFLSGMYQATELGADHVTVEELATADMMQRDVFSQLRKRGIVPTPAATPKPAPNA